MRTLEKKKADANRAPANSLNNRSVERGRPAVKAERAVEVGDGGVRSTTPEPPYLWIHKPALDAIRDGLDDSNSVSDAIALYTVLCEVASDKQSSTFTTTQAWLAAKSGLSTRTLRRRLPELAELGVVEIDTPELKAPSTYTLLRVAGKERVSAPGKVPDRTGCPNDRTGTKTASWPRSEAIQEAIQEATKETKAFLALWAEKYAERHHGRPYLPNEIEDTKAAAKLLGHCRPETIISVARKAWDRADFNIGRSGGFYSKKADSLSGLCQWFNEICTENDFR